MLIVSVSCRVWQLAVCSKNLAHANQLTWPLRQYWFGSKAVLEFFPATTVSIPARMQLLSNRTGSHFHFQGKERHEEMFALLASNQTLDPPSFSFPSKSCEVV